MPLINRGVYSRSGEDYSYELETTYQLKYYISSALISIDCILESEDAMVNRFENKSNYQFEESKFVILSNKIPRNIIEHLDERNMKTIMDRKGAGGFNVLFKDSNSKMEESIRTNRMMYPYILDLVNNKVLFYNAQAKQDEMKQFEFGKIEPICISDKLKLYISNLPNEESNNWNKGLVDEMRAAMKMNIVESEKLGIKPNIDIRKIYSRRFSQMPLPEDASEEMYLQKIADNMICLYFDYSYQDMPLGDWDTNCFDGRLCEEDYAEKVIDFINFVSHGKSTQIPSSVPQWVYSSNHDLQNCHRIFLGGEHTEIYRESLKKWGQVFDSFLKCIRSVNCF